jgi:translation initiation factor IF-1
MKKRDLSGPVQLVAIIGVVEAKKCKCCDHHEIGVRVNEKDGGRFVQFKPGDKVELELTEKEFYRREE